ncbi:MAG TPA: MlaD family protein [Terriglobales bacterium]|nr:MlaD family protein [Terriglobales bacterium]
MLRKSILVLMTVVGVAAIGRLFIKPLRYSRQDIKSCFNDAGGLRAGAPVRIAGVEVGTVRSVRANPQNRSCTAEVEMALATTYKVRIPKDSIAGIETEGMLGEAYLSIDTTQASGAPIENYGYLKSKPSKSTLSLGDQLRAAEALMRLVQTLKETEKEVPNNTVAPTHP